MSVTDRYVAIEYTMNMHHAITSVQSNLAKGRIASRLVHPFLHSSPMCPTHRQTTLRVTSVAIGYILCTACRQCGLKIQQRCNCTTTKFICTPQNLAKFEQ